MIIHRSQTEAIPYNLTFERHSNTGFYESNIAGNALGLDLPQQEHLGLSNDEALIWAFLSRRIGYKPDEEEIFSERVTLDELRIIGSSLLYYSARTNDDLSGITRPSHTQAAARRVEGAMAHEMFETIDRRNIKIPVLSQQSSVWRYKSWVPTI